MASLYKRSDSKGNEWYWLSYTLPNGKRVAKNLHLAKRSDALKAKAILEAQLAQNPLSLVEKDTPIDVFWEKYSVWAESHKRPSTREGDSIWWKKFIDFVKARTLSGVTPSDIEKFKAKLLKDGLKKVTVNDGLKVLQALWNYSIKMGFFNGPNPFKGIPRFKIAKNPPKFLTETELDSLLKAAQDHSPNMHIYVALAALAGFQRREIAFSTWEWFDFDNNRITLQSFDEFQLKDNESRTLPLFRRLKEILLLYRPNNAKGFLLHSGRDSEGKFRYRVDLKRAFATVLQNAKVECTTHQLRHTFGSLLVQKGVPLYEVSLWMGHSDMRTTRGYAHLVVGDKYLDVW